ncbi:MAG: hydantoinase B/oxoprolinase family protein, partial [Burkholderiales bacterium]
EELFDRYGGTMMIQAFEALVRGSERRLRARLTEIPDGSASAEANLDHDGVEVNRPIAVRVTLTKRGDRITVDLSRSDANVAGPINLRPQASESGAALALIGMLDPTIPINDGCRRVFEFINPPGTITHAVKPRPINNYYPTMHLVYTTTQTAFAQLAPDRGVAPSGLGVGALALGFAKTRNGKPGALYELMVPSLGGTRYGDGSFVVMAMAQITPSQPIEIVETEYPVEVTCFEPIIDSAGPGRMRGGSGYRREYKLLDDAMCTVRMGQFVHGAWGVEGGGAPGGASCTLNRGTATEEALPILMTRAMPAGSQLSIRLAGGGGFGPPADRLPELVAADVRDGLVSVERAREVYRVAVDPDSKMVNDAGTAELRSSKG